jgi:hypothetical protein
MGWPLHRRFVSFRNLIPPEDLVDIKLRTNRIEQQHSQRGRRKINIDPGYICKERLILATGKNYVHRVYLNKGVYADLTLVFERGSFRALPWTYRDYAETKMISYFNNIRKRYITQLQEADDID